MPPTQLRVRCLECKYWAKGYFPSILYRADKHAARHEHEMEARTATGAVYCHIHPPVKTVPGF